MSIDGSIVVIAGVDAGADVASCREGEAKIGEVVVVVVETVVSGAVVIAGVVVKVRSTTVVGTV